MSALSSYSDNVPTGVAAAKAYDCRGKPDNITFLLPLIEGVLKEYPRAQNISAAGALAVPKWGGPQRQRRRAAPPGTSPLT